MPALLLSPRSPRGRDGLAWGRPALLPHSSTAGDCGPHALIARHCCSVEHRAAHRLPGVACGLSPRGGAEALLKVVHQLLLHGRLLGRRLRRRRHACAALLLGRVAGACLRRQGVAGREGADLPRRALAALALAARAVRRFFRRAARAGHAPARALAEVRGGDVALHTGHGPARRRRGRARRGIARRRVVVVCRRRQRRRDAVDAGVVHDAHAALLGAAAVVGVRDDREVARLAGGGDCRPWRAFLAAAGAGRGRRGVHGVVEERCRARGEGLVALLRAGREHDLLVDAVARRERAVVVPAQREARRQPRRVHLQNLENLAHARELGAGCLEPLLRVLPRLGLARQRLGQPSRALALALGVPQGRVQRGGARRRAMHGHPAPCAFRSARQLGGTIACSGARAGVGNTRRGHERHVGAVGMAAGRRVGVGEASSAAALANCVIRLIAAGLVDDDQLRPDPLPAVDAHLSRRARLPARLALPAVARPLLLVAVVVPDDFLDDGGGDDQPYHAAGRGPRDTRRRR
mmetsp:Transcript_14955/g.62237  ORF Transcript_14955/g.62237 Transcript_14955/m.62237 type:complete len:522 (-) Transcript_14955:658-2223(-)